MVLSSNGESVLKSHRVGGCREGCTFTISSQFNFWEFFLPCLGQRSESDISWEALLYSTMVGASEGLFSHRLKFVLLCKCDFTNINTKVDCSDLLTEFSD